MTSNRYVAAEKFHLQVGSQGTQLAFPAQAGGTDYTAGRELIQTVEGIADQGVAGVLPWTDHTQAQASGKLHRHILHGVHGDVGLTGQQRGFQFLDEQALAAHFSQRGIQKLIPPGGNADQLDLQVCMNTLEFALYVFCLP